MKTNIFIPTKIKVGYQERKDTYTQKLAYVIYWDEKNKLRKETSWESWRDSKIEPQEFENVPTSGFVLNKKSGGYSTGWNHRQTYCRVYDSRNFEFEITIPNLLYILENTNSIKGKGLEGEFVYGWDGKDLLLIPCDSPDYKELQAFNEVVHNKSYIKAKDLIIGAKYRSKSNEEWIYMGRFDRYDYNGQNEGLQHFFAHEETNYKDEKVNHFNSFKSISGKLIECLDENCVINYAEIMGELEGETIYSPYVKEKDEFIPLTYEEFVDKINNSGYYRVEFLSNHEHASTNSNWRTYKYISLKKEESKLIRSGYTGSYYYYDRKDYKEEYTYEEAYNKYKPFRVRKYLANGTFYQEVSE